MCKNPSKIIKNIVLLLAGIFILCLFLVSCEKENKNNPTSTLTEPKSDSPIDSPIDSLKSKAPNHISPQRYELCADGRNQVSTYTWRDSLQYRLISGKSAGEMCDGDMSRVHYNTSLFGFNIICVGDPNSIGQLKSFGYSPANIIISLGLGSGWQTVVDAAISQGVNRFYIDEPIRNNIQTFVQTCAPYIASQGGTLTISESEFRWYDWYIRGLRGNIGAMIDLALNTYPHPFVCCHTHFDYQTAFTTIDPRDQWTYIQSRVPDLFKMVIIKSRQSYSDMGLLWGCANNRAINQVLLYPFQEDGVTYAGVTTAVEAGHVPSTQWFLLLEVQVQQWWCCAGYTYDLSCGFNYQYLTGNIQWY
jgi:hypothetical protein